MSHSICLPSAGLVRAGLAAGLLVALVAPPVAIAEDAPAEPVVVEPAPAEPSPAEPVTVEPPPAEPADLPPPSYVGAFVGTTLVYRPPGGPTDGPAGDAIVSLAYGRQLTPTVAVELDLSAIIDGEQRLAAIALVPSALYTLSPNLYAALRAIVTTPLDLGDTDPVWNLGLAPGLGAYWPGRVTVSAEANLVSFVGRGDPDLALQLTVGAMYGF